jgi:hypothetical protein
MGLTRVFMPRSRARCAIHAAMLPTAPAGITALFVAVVAAMLIVGLAGAARSAASRHG